MTKRTVIQPNKVYKINQPSMTDYDKLKQIIQAANPEIMELKFGCRVRVKRSHGWEEPVTVIDSSLDGEGDGVISVVDDSGNVEEELDTTLMPDTEIFGRPIRLADVLIAMEAITWFKDDLPKIGRFCLEIWNLKDDNLDHQSDECKEFLIELLVTPKQ